MPLTRLPNEGLSIIDGKRLQGSVINVLWLNYFNILSTINGERVLKSNVYMRAITLQIVVLLKAIIDDKA